MAKVKNSKNSKDGKQIEKKTKGAAKEVTLKEHTELVMKMYKECRKVFFRTSRFRTQVRFSRNAKEKMATAVGTTHRGVRGTSKPLCDTTNPWVEAFWVKRRALYHYYEENTEPCLTQLCDDEGQPITSSDGDPVLRPLTGVRLIRYDRWADFRKGLLERFEAVKQAARNMDDHRSTIFESDKRIIGEEFDERDYDSSFADAVRVDELWLSCERIDSMLPTAERRIQAEAMLNRFNDMLASVVMRRGGQLTDMFENLARALGHEQVCSPDPDGPYQQYDGAVMVPYKNRDHSQEADIPVGKVRVCLRQTVADSRPNRKKSDGTMTVEVYTDPLSPEEIEKCLCPTAGDKRNKLSTSLIENVLGVVNEIRGSFKDLAGPHAAAFEEHLAKVYELIDKFGGSAEDIELNLRDKYKGELNRDKFAEALQDAIPKIADQAAFASEVSRRVMFQDINLDD